MLNIIDIIKKKFKKYLKFIFVFIFLFGYEAFSTENKTKIIAKVNGFPITSYDLNERLNIFLFESNLENSYENKKKFTEDVIDNLIEEELKFQEAKKINPNIIFQAEKKAIELIEKNFGDNQEEVKNNMIKIVSRDNLNAGFKTPFGEIRVPNKYETFNNVSTKNNNSSVNDNNQKFNFHLYSHPSSRTLTENHQNLSMGYTTPKHLKDIQINSVAGASECDSIESIKASYNAQGLKEPRGVDNFENKNSYLR